MRFRFRVFIVIFISIVFGVLLSYLISKNSDFSVLLLVPAILITTLIISIIFSNFTYKNISTLEALTSQIAQGSTKKKFIKALRKDTGEFGIVAKGISEISEKKVDDSTPKKS